MPDFIVLKLNPGRTGHVDPSTLPPGSPIQPPGAVATDWEPVLIVLDAASEEAAVEEASYGAEGEPVYKVLEWPDDREFTLDRKPPEIAEQSVPRLRAETEPATAEDAK